MNIELRYKAPVYGPQDRNGNQPMIKKSVLYLEYVDTESIKSIGWVYDKKGNMDKKRCRIYHENLGNLVIEHSYEEIKRMKDNERVVVRGFMR